MCKFFRCSNFTYRRFGIVKDKHGKSCEFNHPLTCKKIEMFGYKKGGFKDKRCGKLHPSLYRIFMKHENCKFGDKCKYFHPKKLRNDGQKSKPIPSQMYKEEILPYTYAQILKKPIQQPPKDQTPFYQFHILNNLS